MSQNLDSTRTLKYLVLYILSFSPILDHNTTQPHTLCNAATKHFEKLTKVAAIGPRELTSRSQRAVPDSSHIDLSPHSWQLQSLSCFLFSLLSDVVGNEGGKNRNKSPPFVLLPSFMSYFNLNDNLLVLLKSSEHSNQSLWYPLP